MIRFGLCCIFREEPIRFRQTTAASLSRLNRDAQLQKISGICLDNLKNLLLAVGWVDNHKTGAFRVLSPLFPRFTHPDVGYRLDILPDKDEILSLCSTVKNFCNTRDIRLSLHPDQFNILSSPHDHVVANTLRELEYQGLLAELIGAELINIHAGGIYTGKEGAISRFQKNFRLLSNAVRSRLTVENDDRCYTPEDLFPLCRNLEIPFVYDVHHHRCLPDRLDVEEATERCIQSWTALGREPFFHLSSPKHGWGAAKRQPHSDYIDVADFPHCWTHLTCTIDIEAKAKELAVLRLKKDVANLTVEKRA